jgi:hypothetical protein
MTADADIGMVENNGCKKYQFVNDHRNKREP